VKAAVALLIIFTVVLSPVVWCIPVAAAIVVLILAMLISRIPLRFILRRILIVEPFVIVVAFLALFQPDGVQRFTAIVVKSTASLMTVIVLANTTPFTELLALLRRVHIPKIFVAILALMYRYFFVLADEMERMQRARLSRTFTPRRTHKWHLFSTIISQLFLRSTRRAERIYSSMCARGWQ
jgi:cobalt/nickel transport system permease protein